MPEPNTQHTHRWSFVRLGGFDQVVLDDGEDIAALHLLDQKLWGALASPVKGTYLDEQTLKRIDTDSDGRIRAPEVLAAVAWMAEVIQDLGEITARTDGLPLAKIRQDTEAGRRVFASAERLLQSEQVGGDRITVAATTHAASTLHALPFNGDGVITIKTIAQAAVDNDEAALRRVFEEVMRCVGSVEDRSGEQGIDGALLTAFYEALHAYESWWTDAEQREDEVIPLGDGTARAVEAYRRIRAKIEDYFMRCELIAFDPRARPHMVGNEARWSELGTQLLDEDTPSVEGFPLARIEPERPLRFDEGVNPGWREELQRFKKAVVEPLCGEDTEELTRQGWEELEQRFLPYTTWLEEKRGEQVEELGIERIRELIGGEERAALEELVARDEEVKPQADAVDEVDRAARYYRDLHVLLENFVNFRDFYDPDRLAIFQSGVLYLDGRSCALCIDVEAPDAHVAMAQRSYAYLAYCECRRKGHDGVRHIVAAFTDGDNDYLIKGRNGVFYDREGKDWDARITQIVEQPISIRQAFWSPYKRLFRFVSSQIESFTAEREAQTQKKLDAGISQTQKSLVSSSEKANAEPVASDATPKAEAGRSSGFDIAKYAGIFAAIGLAAGFIISSVTLLVTAFLGLKPWQMPLVVLGIILVISGPSMLLAAFKLHQRHLAPLLDANGWAVNTRAKLNIPFGAALTDVSKLPKGARHTYTDPYKERRLWPWVFTLAGLALGAAVVWWLWHDAITAWLAR